MKFVISDLDGTLLKTRNVVSPFTKETIKKLTEKGINFAIATGRGKQGVQNIIEQLNLNPYLICNNGANIYDAQGTSIFEQTIEKDIVIKILKAIKENGLFYSAFFNEHFYRDKDDTYPYSSRNLFVEHTLNSIEECPALNKIIVTDDNPQVISNLSKILREKFEKLVEITISQPDCLDIVPKGCSKGNALKHLAEIFNTTTDLMMAFGDGENDLDMLRVVGHPVIMENAQEILKKEFSTVTFSNINDGVAKYLTKYFAL